MDDQKDRPRVRKHLKEFSDYTTFHGLRHVTDGNHNILRRLIWLVLVLGLTTLFLWFTAQQFLLYLKKPTATRVTVKELRPLPFPAVTMCNLNRFKKSVAVRSNVSAHVLEDIYHNRVHHHPTLPPHWDEPDYIYFLEHTDTYQFGKEAAHGIDMFEECRWKEEVIDCNEYLEMIPTGLGFCFKFNPIREEKNKTLQIIRTGSHFGLHLRINIQHDEYYYGPGSAVGMKILLHDPHVVPLIEELGSVISPGTETYASVKMLKLIGLPPPYEHGVCNRTDDPDFSHNLAYYGMYSRQACRAECARNYTVEHCGCKLPYMRGNDSVPYCGFNATLFCALDAVEDYEHDDEYFEHCECVSPCEEDTYQVFLSQAFFPSPSVMDYLAEYQPGKTEQEYRETYLDLKVYYEELNYDLVEQTPAYELPQFGSDIGGLLGLTVGASILTVCEFLDLLFVVWGTIFAKGRYVAERKSSKKDSKKEDTPDKNSA